MWTGGLPHLPGIPHLDINRPFVDCTPNRVSPSKSLGILIDTNLTWGSHVEKLAKKNCLWYCSYIKRVRQFVPLATLHLIYKALIQPHFDYCNQARIHTSFHRFTEIGQICHNTSL